MKHLVLFINFLFLFTLANAQENLNMELVANVSVNEQGNDIWGYKDINGIEYAVIGSFENTTIFSLEDPANPIERIKIQGAGSTWRDMKSWNTHIYVTTDSGSDGLLIIDMTNAPADITFKYWTPMLEITQSTPTLLQKCHNLYIDENGVCYLAGCNSAGGSVILDITTDPDNPIQLGANYNRYAHDIYVHGDTMYSSEIYQGEFTMYDVSDKSNIVALGSQLTSTIFTHNAWLSDDGKYLFTTDEKENAYVDAYDITDPTNIKFLDKYQPLETENKDVIPHNTHYYDGYLVTSWYTDGIVVIDAKRPHNLIKVGSYDTYLGPDGGFSGCWGAFPFLESGYILGSDMQTGLYVLEVNYPRACWLEGSITDCESGQAINGVDVNIISQDLNRESSDPMGFYATGQVTPGIFMVEFTHPEYLTVTASATLVNDELTILDIEMCAKATYLVDIVVVDEITNDPIPFADIVLVGEGITVTEAVNSIGELSTSYYEGTYDLYVGSWGHYHKLVSNVEINETKIIEVELERGYQDDFIFAHQWVVLTNTNVGIWERGVPNGTTFQGSISNPNEDVQTDYGNECYVTGNAANVGAGQDDIDDGKTILTSPNMELKSNYIDPIIKFNLWFFNAGGAGPINDKVILTLDNGITSIDFDEILEVQSAWQAERSYLVSDFIEVTDNMTFSVDAEDVSPGHLMEVGLDAFIVTEGGSVGTSNIEIGNLELSPNPANDFIQLDLDQGLQYDYTITDVQGKIFQQSSLKDNKLDVSAFANGIYFIKLMQGNEIIGVNKFVVQH